MTRRSAILAVIVTALTASVAIAWDAPALASECAPDEDHYAWVIVLPAEKNQVLQLSFDDFDTHWTVDFESAGSHPFTTERGGDRLSVRYKADHDASTSLDANGELCFTETPSPTPSEEPTPTPEATPTPTPDGPPESVEPTPTASIPDTAAAVVPFQIGPDSLLLALLGVLVLGFLLTLAVVRRR